MSVAVPDPGHALDAVGPEPVKRHRNLHIAISDETVVVAEEHDLVMVPKPVVGDGYRSRSPRDVEQAILTLVERVVIDPYFPRRDYPYGISVFSAKGDRLASTCGHRPGWHHPVVVELQAVDYDIVRLYQI